MRLKTETQTGQMALTANLTLRGSRLSFPIPGLLTVTPATVCPIYVSQPMLSGSGVGCTGLPDGSPEGDTDGTGTTALEPWALAEGRPIPTGMF